MARGHPCRTMLPVRRASGDGKQTKSSTAERRAGRNLCASALALILLAACGSEKAPVRTPDASNIANRSLPASPPSESQVSVHQIV